MTDKTELGATEKQLRNALERLIDKKPTNRDLKKKLKANKLKIGFSNVEKEAGLSNGALKHYPELKKEITEAELERVSGSSDVSVEVILKHPLYVKAKDELAKAKAEIKKIKDELEKKDKKLDDYKERLKSQAVAMHQVNVAMWKHIPEEAKHVELMIDVHGMETQSNILDFKKREKLE